MTPAGARILYVIACGTPASRDVGKLVALAQQRDWSVCVVLTPDARKFVDVPGLAAQTGHPVRADYKNPGDPDLLPPADAVIVAPATSNTINKWAAGITDTLALGLVVEAQGKGLPIVTLPFTNTALAGHPAFQASVTRLREWGVQVLYGEDVLPLQPPGGGEQIIDRIPWQLTLDALDERLTGS